MTDWRLWGLALAFVYLMARLRDDQFSPRAMKFAGILVLALAGHQVVLPMIAGTLAPAQATEAVAEGPGILDRIRDALPRRAGDTPWDYPRIGYYELFAGMNQDALIHRERFLSIQVLDVKPKDDPITYYLLREVRSEMSRRGIPFDG